MNRTVAFIERGRGVLVATLESPEAMALLVPFGYGEAEVRTLLGRIEQLAVPDSEQEVLKGVLRANTVMAREAAEEFSRQFLPWRKRLGRALAGRPEYRTQLGLTR